MHKIVFLTVSILISLSLGAFANAERMQLGQLAPNWMLYSAQSEPTLLYDVTDQEKTVVMLFWATWCGQCNQLLHELQGLSDAYNIEASRSNGLYLNANHLNTRGSYANYTNDGIEANDNSIIIKSNDESGIATRTAGREAQSTSPVVFYILNVWEDKDAQAYLAKKGITLPVLVRAESVADRYGIEGVPGVIVVKPNRRISLYHSAGKPVDQLMAQITRTLPALGSQSGEQ